MRSSNEAFLQLIAAILERYCRQNEVTSMSAADVTAIGARLWVLVTMRGIPAVSSADEPPPPEMKAEEVAPLVAAVLEGLRGAADLAVPVRQLVKTCFQAERRICRDSYREKTPDRSCRRQELQRVRGRISGSHCVDCPYWNELDQTAHAQLLAQAWCGRPEEFTAHRELFLPEDFRALRKWLRGYAGRSVVAASV